MTITVSRDPRVAPLIWDLLDKAKINNGIITVGTHDGGFHADELLSIAMIKVAISEVDTYHGPDIHVNVIRTRNLEKLKQCDIVVDVGGGEFDHHSTDDRYPNGVPKSACGKVLEAVEPNDKLVKLLNIMGLYLVQSIDNGDPISKAKWIKYQPSHFSWVGLMNPTYSERYDPEASDLWFNKALDMVEIVYRRLRQSCLDFMASKEVLSKCPRYLGGALLELPSSSVQWKPYVLSRNHSVKAVMYPHQDGMWCVRMVPRSFSDSTPYHRFPEEWRSDAKAIAGNTQIASKGYSLGCKFAHKGGHLANFDTKDHAIEAADYVFRHL